MEPGPDVSGLEPEMNNLNRKSPLGQQLTQFRPRTHSIIGVSRAKIKTVKLTIVVIACYILCSAPFTCVQLYSVYADPGEGVCKYQVSQKKCFFSNANIFIVRSAIKMVSTEF